MNTNFVDSKFLPFKKRMSLSFKKTTSLNLFLSKGGINVYLKTGDKELQA